MNLVCILYVQEPFHSSRNKEIKPFKPNIFLINIYIHDWWYSLTVLVSDSSPCESINRTFHSSVWTRSWRSWSFTNHPHLAIQLHEFILFKSMIVLLGSKRVHFSATLFSSKFDKTIFSINKHALSIGEQDIDTNCYSLIRLFFNWTEMKPILSYTAYYSARTVTMRRSETICIIHIDIKTSFSRSIWDAWINYV